MRDFELSGEGRILTALKYPWGIWVFLTTHGMWYHSAKPGRDDLSIDLRSGRTTLVISHELYQLIKAIESIPLFHLSVDDLVAVKEGGYFTPQGVHSKIKDGEIRRVSCEEILEVTPLTFHAASSGIHRIGFYHRIMAFQQSLSKRIARVLSLRDSIPAPYEVFSVKEEQEIRGSLAALLSGIIKWGRIDFDVLKEELTTSVIEPPREEDLRGIRTILRNLGDIVPDVARDNKKDLMLSFGASSVDKYVESSLSYINRVCLGRLKCYDGLAEEFAKESLGEFDLAIDFSEQMGPLDIYLILLILESAGVLGGCGNLWIIGTPLTYPTAMYSLLYVRRCLQRKETSSRLVISSEDPTFSKVAAERISNGMSRSKKIVYIAAGPTSHVVSFYKTLIEKRGRESVRAIPLSPHR
jgi:hypothetical protein